jgi:hypothetical protein
MSNEETKESEKINLGELGSFESVNEKEIDDVFDHLEGVVFKLKKCMFRISYINKGKRTYTATLINEK